MCKLRSGVWKKNLHLFLMINNNPKITSVVYYYLKDEDREELPHHLKKPVTYKKVAKLWNSMK